MMLKERNCQKGDNLGDIQACERLLPTGQRKTQSCKAVSNCLLYTSCPENLPVHPEGMCQQDAQYSSALLNPEVHAKMGRAAAATSKQREVVPVTMTCSCGTSEEFGCLQRSGLWNRGDNNQVLSSCFRYRGTGQGQTSKASGLICSVRFQLGKGTSEQGNRQLGSLCRDEDIHRHL